MTSSLLCRKALMNELNKNGKRKFTDNDDMIGIMKSKELSQPEINTTITNTTSRKEPKRDDNSIKNISDSALMDYISDHMSGESEIYGGINDFYLYREGDTINTTRDDDDEEYLEYMKSKEHDIKLFQKSKKTFSPMAPRKEPKLQSDIERRFYDNNEEYDEVNEEEEEEEEEAKKEAETAASSPPPPPESCNKKKNTQNNIEIYLKNMKASYNMSLPTPKYKISYNNAVVYFCWKHLWWSCPKYQKKRKTDSAGTNTNTPSEFWIHPVTKRPVMSLSQLVLRIGSDMIAIRDHVNKRVDSFQFIAEALINISRKGTCLKVILMEIDDDDIYARILPGRTPTEPVVFDPGCSEKVMEKQRMCFYFDDSHGQSIDKLLNCFDRKDPKLLSKPIYIQDMFAIHKSIFQKIAENEISRIFA